MCKITKIHSKNKALNCIQIEKVWEATANIDPENEDKLKEAIESLTKNKTVIMIAHRLKTIRNADQILVLKDGEIAERGNHEELIKNNGLYSDLINAKAMAESWKLNNW